MDTKDSSGDASVVAVEVPDDVTASSKEEGNDGAVTRDLPRRTDRLTLPIIIVLIAGGLERAGFFAVITPWRMWSICFTYGNLHSH